MSDELKLGVGNLVVEGLMRHNKDLQRKIITLQQQIEELEGELREFRDWKFKQWTKSLREEISAKSAS